MLKIGQATLEMFDAQARPTFVGRLHDVLADKYPQFLPRFPRSVALLITDHMLQRAEREGLRLQSSLLAWCELMIIVAADFDRNPAVRRVLDDNPTRLDFVIRDLPHIVDDADWECCEAEGSSLPFFHPPASDDAHLAERTAAAIDVTLGDRIEPGEALDAAEWAIADAQRMGLVGVTDAPLVLAACRAFYPEPQDWLAEVLADPMPPRAKVEAIRFRLALDFGRVL